MAAECLVAPRFLFCGKILKWFPEQPELARIKWTNFIFINATIIQQTIIRKCLRNQHNWTITKCFKLSLELSQGWQKWHYIYSEDLIVTAFQPIFSSENPKYLAVFDYWCMRSGEIWWDHQKIICSGYVWILLGQDHRMRSGSGMLWIGLVSGCSVIELGVVVGSGAIDQKLPPSTAG